MASARTDTIIGAILGGVLVFYLIANTYEDMTGEIDGINDSTTGSGLIKLLPIFLAIGVVVAVYRMFSKKK